MDDLLQGTSAFDAGVSSFDPGASAFDATTIDSNLQSISAIERTWRLPPIPEEVKFDLAALPGVTPGGLTGLLQGLDADFNDPGDGVEAPEQPPLEVVRTGPERERSTWDRLRVEFADIIGEPHPEEPSVDANALFKKYAIERGYLPRPEDGRVDGTWSPELNSVRWDIAQDDYDDRLRGDRTGAVPMSGLMETIGTWTSPGGLLSAATDLDLFWDFGAIEREFSSWGDKIRKVGESENPFDFAKNLVDAVTGPVDDIVMPILNWAMIGSGVGAGSLLLRGAASTGKIRRGFQLIDRLYAPRKATEAGLLGARLARSSGAGRRAVGGYMAAWRQQPVVAATKAATGSGMRLGATSLVQDALPGYQGGVSLRDVSPTVDTAATALRATADNPAFLPVELAFAPQNIWVPGTFLGRKADGANLLGNTGRLAVRAFGSNTGRAAIGATVGAGAGIMLGDDGGDTLAGAAIGGFGLGGAPLIGKGGRIAVDLSNNLMNSLKSSWEGLETIGSSTSWVKSRNPGLLSRAIGSVADAAARLDYRPLAEDQRVAAAFDRAIRRKYADSPEILQVYLDEFTNSNSFLAAYGKLIGTTDPKQTAASVAYLMKSASIDKAAAEFARTAEGGIDHARYHRYRNKLTAQSRYFDLESGDTRRLIHEAAMSYATQHADTAPDIRRTYDQVVTDWLEKPESVFEWMEAHNELARRTNAQLLSPSILDDLEPGAVDAFGETSVAGQLRMSDDADVNVGTLEAYLMKDVDFQNWNEFTVVQEEIARLDQAGLLDASVLKPARSWDTGVEIGYKGYEPGVNRKAKVVEDQMMDLLLDGSYQDSRKFGGQWAPFARTNPSGSFTVMRADTTTAGQLVELRRELQDLARLHEAFESLDAHGFDLNKFEQLANLERVGDLSDDAVYTMIKQLEKEGFSTSSTAAVKRIGKFSRSLGKSGADVRAQVSRRIDELANDLEFWEQRGLDRFARTEDGVLAGIPALKARERQLNQAIQYTAAEVDLDAMIDRARVLGRADELEELEALKAGLGDRYKLVHGVEYQMPRDLALDDMHFGDMTVRNMNAATLGNYFRGRLPAQARALEDMRQRNALARVFQETDDLRDLDPDDETVSSLLADMRDVLDEYQSGVSANLRTARESETRLARPLTYVRTSIAPQRLEDLRGKKDLLISGLRKRGWTQEEAEAAWRAVPKFRNTEFRDLGLYALEAKLRSRSQLVDSLKIVGGTKGFSPMRAGAGALVGAGVGGALAAGENEDASLGARALGFVAGGAAATGVSGVARRAIDPAAMVQAGYLADNLVKARDTLRFTLSPFFDASRYTEGLMLGQAGAPLRTPDGRRFVMPVNSSPSKLKRELARNPVRLEDGSTLTFDRVRAEFQASATRIGDFDPEVLDQAGRWFQSVGILGFDPTEWMATAFGHMRRQGFGADEAYEHARAMYTYATSGGRSRSAADLSVNFIFFPFSFQKKALTHLGDWITDDLSRSIILHDMYQTYQILDERFDLDAMWEDHVPVMQALQRLNLFAFGLSPGRFGGINAQAFESAGKLAFSAVFSPNGTSLRDHADFAELQRLQRSVAPVLNDINWMTEAVKEQGHVLLSESHLTSRAEVREGYAEWNDYKTQLNETLRSSGYTLADLFNKPWLEGMRLQYEMKRAELGEKYTAWGARRREVTGNRVSLDMEKRDRLALARSGSVEAKDSDLQMLEMEQLLGQAKQLLEYRGIPVGGNDGWDNAPPELFAAVHETAQGFLAENPKFESVWEKFYKDDFGFLFARV